MYHIGKKKYNAGGYIYYKIFVDSSLAVEIQVLGIMTVLLSIGHFCLIVLPGFPDDYAREKDQCDQVWDGHQSIHDVGESPDCIDFSCCAYQDGDNPDDSIGKNRGETE